MLPVNLIEGIISIQNKFDFLTLENVSLKWELIANGLVIQNGILQNVDINPGGKQELIIPYRKLDIESNTEYHLKITSSLKNDTIWAEKGHIIAWDQFRVPFTTPLETKSPKNIPKVESDEHKEFFEIYGKEN